MEELSSSCPLLSFWSIILACLKCCVLEFWRQFRVHPSSYLQYLISEAVGYLCVTGLGIRGEESCLPCLRCNEGGLSQDADDYCNICWTEPLGCAPCIRLKCGHIFHHSSIMSMLGMKWGGLWRCFLPLANSHCMSVEFHLACLRCPVLPADYRIHFNFMDCPLCKAEMDHPSLDSILSPMRALKLAVRVRLSLPAPTRGPPPAS